MARGMSSVTRADSLAISARIESSSLWNSERRSAVWGATSSLVGGAHPNRPVT